MKEHVKNGWQGAKAGLWATVVIWASAATMGLLTIVPGMLKGAQVNLSGPLLTGILVIGVAFPLIGFVFGVILSVYLK